MILGIIVLFQILVRLIISKSGDVTRPINYLSGRLAFFSVVFFAALGIYFEVVVFDQGHDLAFVNFRLLLLFYVTIYLSRKSSFTILGATWLTRIILWGLTTGTLYFLFMTLCIYLLTLGMITIIRRYNLPQIYLISTLDIILGILWATFYYLQLPYFGTVSIKIALFNWVSFVIMNAILEFGLTHLNQENNYLTMLSHQATTDPLTKMNNYLSFKEDFDKLYTSFHKNNQSLAMIALDIDYFKRINDTYGHLAGNQVLEQIAKILMDESAKSEGAQAYRVGGEEFNILLPNLNLQETNKFSHHLQDRIRYSLFPVNDLRLHLTVSMGVAILHEHDVTSNLLYERADQMLYHSKGQGRNRITLENELN